MELRAQLVLRDQRVQQVLQVQLEMTELLGPLAQPVPRVRQELMD